MKNNFTKPFLLSIVLVTFILGGIFAQQLPSTSMYKHGTNSANTSSDVSWELTDSVTVGGTLDYFVMPDALASPLFDATASLKNNLNSNATFTWSYTGPVGAPAPTITTKATFNDNYKTVQWGSGATAIGDYTLKVVEGNGAGCIDAGGTSIPVTLINAPTANFSSATSTQCTSTPGTVTFNLPLSLATDLKNNRLTVSFSVVYTTTAGVASPAQTFTDVALTESGTLSLNTLLSASLAYGSYAITITDVKDRISVKSNVAGVVGSTPTYTYVVTRLPKTGAIYHLPNM